MIKNYLKKLNLIVLCLALFSVNILFAEENAKNAPNPKSKNDQTIKKDAGLPKEDRFICYHLKFSRLELDPRVNVPQNSNYWGSGNPLPSVFFLEANFWLRQLREPTCVFDFTNDTNGISFTIPKENGKLTILCVDNLEKDDDLIFNISITSEDLKNAKDSIIIYVDSHGHRLPGINKKALEGVDTKKNYFHKIILDIERVFPPDSNGMVRFEGKLNFSIKNHEVTQKEYQEVMGVNPSFKKGDNLPVENVSWHDAMEYCKKLTEREKEAGRLPKGFVYTLPTSAQWDCACVRYYDDNLSNFAWHKWNSENSMHPVAQKKPNELGIYDMVGNVWEWCLEKGLIRGGCYFTNSSDLGNFEPKRLTYEPVQKNKGWGFRVVLVPEK